MSDLIYQTDSKIGNFLAHPHVAAPLKSILSGIAIAVVLNSAHPILFTTGYIAIQAAAIPSRPVSGQKTSKPSYTYPIASQLVSVADVLAIGCLFSCFRPGFSWTNTHHLALLGAGAGWVALSTWNIKSHGGTLLPNAISLRFDEVKKALL